MQHLLYYHLHTVPDAAICSLAGVLLFFRNQFTAAIVTHNPASSLSLVRHGTSPHLDTAELGRPSDKLRGRSCAQRPYASFLLR
jgi:hypothetical protein